MTLAQSVRFLRSRIWCVQIVYADGCVEAASGERAAVRSERQRSNLRKNEWRAFFNIEGFEEIAGLRIPDDDFVATCRSKKLPMPYTRSGSADDGA